MKKNLLVLVALLFSCAFAMAQKTVTGTITDPAGVPLIGASVVADGTSSGTITDIDGKFSLNVSDAVKKIIVSYTGYDSQIIDLTSGKTDFNLSLTEGKLIDEVVVTALGISRDEKSIGYAVQELDGASLAQSKEDNIVNALQGQIAGVQIQGSPSSIGGSSRITIRGANSFLGNNQPLFVVDGVPIDNSSFSTARQQRGFSTGNDGQSYDFGNTASDIDPASIESMSVLKGAAATAIYGQRGANGVILITTKKGGKNEGFGVDVNSSVTWDNVANLIPVQTAYGGGSIASTESGFTEFTQDGVKYYAPAYQKDGSWGPKYDKNRMVRHWDSWDPNDDEYKKTRPWVAPANDYSAFFDTGLTLNNNVGVSGGTDKGSFRLGYTNVNKKGVIPGGKLNKNAVSFNSDYDIHERINVGLSANYVNTKVKNRNVTGYNNANPMQAFTQWWQAQLDVERLKNKQNNFDGSQATWNPKGISTDDEGNLLGFNSKPNYFDNPFWVRSNMLQEDERNRVFGKAHVTVKLLEGLTATGQFGTDFYGLSLVEGVPNGSVDESYYGETERRFQETNLEGRLNYTNNFGRISFSAMAGANKMRQSKRATFVNTVGGLNLDGFYSLSNSKNPVSYRSGVGGSDYYKKGINSVFGTASVGLDNWLYLDVTARNDWSSTLPKEHNSYFYPSVSLSAAISELPLFKNIEALSFAKVRASYAQVGNDANPYSLLPTYDPQDPSIQGNARYGVPNSRPNPDLKPEITSEVEFGVDFRLFKDRLGVDVAYFDRTTKNQIFNVPSSASTGFTSRTLNAGSMRNSGIELAINAVPVQTRNFSWGIGANVYKQNNEVVELLKDENGKSVIESINMGGTWAADIRIAEGYPYMAIFGQDFIRENYEVDADGNITKNEGQPVVDENGIYKFTDERVYLGSAMADWTGGFNTSFDIMGVRLSGLFDWQIGGTVHSTSLQWSKYSGMHPETVEFNGESDVRANGMVLPGVDSEGKPNDIRINPQDYYQVHWRKAAPNIYDASYLKLRELRLDFNLPKSLFANTTMRGASIGLFGRNLAILASNIPYLDPQGVNGAGNIQGLENAQVPSTRSYGVNLKLNL